MELFRSPSSEFLHVDQPTTEGSNSTNRGRRYSMTNWEATRRETLPQPRQYVIFAAPPFVQMAKKMEASAPSRFRFLPIQWNKFPDGTDDITIEGFTPHNLVASSHILFFASFHNNDVTLSQFSVLIVLLQSFIRSMTIVLPFYPVGTNERVTVEGKVATANTYSTLLSSLPSIGTPTRLMVYDIHALQTRFYFSGATLPSLHSAVPLLLERLKNTHVDAVCFPDDGANKRYAAQFRTYGFACIVCGKVRDGDKRFVRITDGEAKGKSVVIVDDLVQTGGTLYECAVALQEAGAVEVNAFVAHAVFPQGSSRRFLPGGDRAAFKNFWVTNSIPSVTDNLQKIKDADDTSCFEVLDLCPLIRRDLDEIHK